MSESDPKNVRRFGQADRKDRLARPDSLFPAEEEASPSEPPPELDLDNLALPDTNQQAIESLAKLSEENVRAPVITPEQERYPPLAPAESEAQSAAVDAEPPPAPSKYLILRYNLLTIIGVLGTILTIAWVGVLWFNPQSEWNPLPPSTPFVVVTATPASGLPSPTPNESGQIIIVATQTAAPTSTQSLYPFVLSGSVVHAPNANDLGCNWWSIAGTVTDLNGDALNGYRIHIEGEGLDETVFSGAALTFGPGGFELPLIGTPQEAEFTVTLASPEGAPLSEPAVVTTRADCAGNVAIVNFVQNR